VSFPCEGRSDTAVPKTGRYGFDKRINHQDRKRPDHHRPDRLSVASSRNHQDERDRCPPTPKQAAFIHRVLQISYVRTYRRLARYCTDHTIVQALMWSLPDITATKLLGCSPHALPAPLN